MHIVPAYNRKRPCRNQAYEFIQTLVRKFNAQPSAAARSPGVERRDGQGILGSNMCGSKLLTKEFT